MKKIPLLLAFLFSFAFANSFGQVPTVTLGNIPANAKKDGKMVPVYTTSDRIIQAGKLKPGNPSDKIESYLFSVATGSEMWGPFEGKGAQLSDKMISRLKETKGPGVLVFFDDIKVKQGGVVKMARPLSFKYDQ